MGSEKPFICTQVYKCISKNMPTPIGPNLLASLIISLAIVKDQESFLPQTPLF